MRLRFTIRDLLAMVFIASLLLSIVSSWVLQARETARANSCRNNLTSACHAIIWFEAQHVRYPDYQPVMTTSNGHAMQVGWLTSLLPVSYVGRPDIYSEYMNFAPSPPVDIEHATAGSLAVSPYPPASNAYPVKPPGLMTLVCPSNQSGIRNNVFSYVLNTGRVDDPSGLSSGIPVDFPDNGVFQTSQILQTLNSDCYQLGRRGRSSDSGFIARHDGLSTTLMLSERLDAGKSTDIHEQDVGFVWHPAVDPLPTTPRDLTMCVINGRPILAPAKRDERWARPSSAHPGGVNVAFAGGNVRFLSEKITYHLYILLMTPNGFGARDPATGVPTQLTGAIPGQTAGHRFCEDDDPIP